jgi:hypothetical protein
MSAEAVGGLVQERASIKVGQIAVSADGDMPFTGPSGEGCRSYGRGLLNVVPRAAGPGTTRRGAASLLLAACQGTTR